jgi:hypothetical protein
MQDMSTLNMLDKQFTNDFGFGSINNRFTTLASFSFNLFKKNYPSDFKKIMLLIKFIDDKIRLSHLGRCNEIYQPIAYIRIRMISISSIHLI